MKTKWLVIVALLFSGTLAAQQPATPPASPQAAALKPDSGSISGNIYTNDFFGFSYPFPDGWHAQSQKAQREVVEEGHRAFHGDDPAESEEHQGAMKWTWFLFQAKKDPQRGPQGPSVQIAAFDLTGDPSFKDAKDFLSQTGATMKATGAQLLQAPTETTIAGRTFVSDQYMVQGMTPDHRRGIAYWASAITVDRHYVLIWFFFSDDQPGLHDLLQSLNGISFKDPPDDSSKPAQ